MRVTIYTKRKSQYKGKVIRIVDAVSVIDNLKTLGVGIRFSKPIQISKADIKKIVIKEG